MSSNKKTKLKTKAKTIKNIHDAIVDYIYNHTMFESNEAIDGVISKIEHSTSIEDIFRIPINCRLLNFTGSLQWLYFVCFIITTIKDEQIIIPNTFNIKFSTDDAIIYISNVYNVANKVFYEDYLEKSDSEQE